MSAPFEDYASARVCDAALEFLELDAQTNDAYVKSKCRSTDDDLYREAHMLGERRETARRVLADRLIEYQADWNLRVRNACKFPAIASNLGMMVKP